MRLNKFLASAGIASRRKCDEIILSGEVSINDKQVRELGIQVDETKDIVKYKGKVLKPTANFIYLKLNKPKGYICTSKDDKERKTVYELINIAERIFTVGRLDFNTEGLLILTNNGEIAQALIHPSFELEKEYHCTIKGDINNSEIAKLRNGVIFENQKLPKAKVSIISKELDENNVVKTKLSIIINQGINRQIRKMISGINKKIISLKRVRIAEIELGDLKIGEHKNLTEQEINIINKYYKAFKLKQNRMLNNK